MKYLLSFLLGVLSFAISQLFLRLPLLSWFLKSTTASVVAIKHPLLLTLFLAMTAGLFEEPFRALMLKVYPLKQEGLGLPLMLGLGHGIFEAFWLYFTVLPQGSFVELLPGLIERGIAILIHVALTLFIFEAFLLKKAGLGLGLAVVFHAFINAGAVLIEHRYGLRSVMLFMAVIALLAIVYIGHLLSDRRFEKRGFPHETF